MGLTKSILVIAAVACTILNAVVAAPAVKPVSSLELPVVTITMTVHNCTVMPWFTDLPRFTEIPKEPPPGPPRHSYGPVESLPYFTQGVSIMRRSQDYIETVTTALDTGCSATTATEGSPTDDMHHWPHNPDVSLPGLSPYPDRSAILPPTAITLPYEIQHNEEKTAMVAKPTFVNKRQVGFALDNLRNLEARVTHTPPMATEHPCSPADDPIHGSITTGVANSSSSQAYKTVTEVDLTCHDGSCVLVTTVQTLPVGPNTLSGLPPATTTPLTWPTANHTSYSFSSPQPPTASPTGIRSSSTTTLAQTAKTGSPYRGPRHPGAGDDPVTASTPKASSAQPYTSGAGYAQRAPGGRPSPPHWA